MTYAEAVARLTALRGGEHAGMRPGLERITGLLAALGNPEERYTLVQVGGTNGKGTIAATVGRPAATVVSRIDLDHEAVLGTTLAAIAAEKAAIIRSGVALSAAQAPEVAEVIGRRAQAVGVPIRVEGRDLHVAVRRRSLAGQVLTCRGPGWTFDGLATRLAGTYQPSNALLAVAAARELGADEAAIRRGLARVQWPGRFQVIGREPTFVLDAAHNPAGARALAASLHEYFPGQDITIIIGVSRDKDAASILGTLAPLARRMILTRARNPRAADPRTLAAVAPTAEITASVTEALARARRTATPVVCVAGSVFVVGEALAEVSGRGGKTWTIANTPDSIESLFS